MIWCHNVIYFRRLAAKTLAVSLRKETGLYLSRILHQIVGPGWLNPAASLSRLTATGARVSSSSSAYARCLGYCVVPFFLVRRGGCYGYRVVCFGGRQGDTA